MEERKSQYELFLEEEERKAQPTKRCSKCRKFKAVSEYHKHQRGKYGVQSKCKTCSSEDNPKRKYKNRVDRFWKTFHPRTIKVGECIEWTGSYTSDGQPSCQWSRKQTTVSRMVYILSCGDIPDDMVVMHTCKNKRCVRQNHLRLGTRNDLDIKIRNNMPTGDKHGSRKHPERRARGERHGSRTHPERLRRGDNHPSRLHPERLARGERHGSCLHPESVLRGSQNRNAKLTEEKVRTIRELNKEGMSQRAIARRFEVARSTVRLILRGKTWKHVQ